MKVTFCILILICASCAQNDSPTTLIDDEMPTGIWKRFRIEYIYADKEHEKLVRAYPPKEEKNYYLNIFPDGKGSVMWKTELDPINWRLAEMGEDDKEYTPLIAKGDYQNIEIGLTKFEGDQVIKAIHNNGSTISYFRKEEEITSIFLEDPYHPDNNYWRIRTKRALSDSEINAKVQNYLLHYKYLFKASIDSRGERNFKNTHSLGILVVYKGAFGTVAKHSISEDWYSYFYSEAEALKAYNLLTQMIESDKKVVKPTGNWIEDNYNILDNILTNSK